MKHLYRFFCLVIPTVFIVGCAASDLVMLNDKYRILKESGNALGQDNVIRTQNAYMVCTTPDMNWINFCNGLMQGYADYVALSGQACIPVGVTRTQLVTVFTSKLIKMTEAYKKDKPAIEGASEVFALAYPCKSG